MEAIQQSMAQMSEMFNKRMLEFQHELEKTAPTSTLASPPSRLASDFLAFRSFVVTSLQCIQTQIDSLFQLYDSLDMRNRRKIVLLNGVPEDGEGDPASICIDVITKHLKVTDLSTESIGRCHRMGASKDGKPRPILIKFRSHQMKQHIWSSKVNFKGSGITISEFLTKHRHSLFMAARERFGIHKCWTRDGRITVMGPDGARHRIESSADMKAIGTDPAVKAAPPISASSKDTKGPVRTKRPIRAK